MNGDVVVQHLCVLRSPEFGAFIGGVDRVWLRAVPMRFLPAAGDEVALWAGGDGDPAGGPLWPVRLRCWGSGGSVQLDLVDMRVDPDEEAVDAIMRVPGVERVWSTERDGSVADLEAGLARGGWTFPARH